MKIIRGIKSLQRRFYKLRWPMRLAVAALGLTVVGGGVYAGLGGFGSPQPEPNLSAGLVGYWDFNGDAQDSSGSNNHGTVSGATLAADRHGNANSAYSFDGGDHILHPTAGMSAQQGTVAGWVKPSQSASWGFWQTHDSDSTNFLDWIAMFSYSSDTFYYRLGNGTACCTNDLTFSPTSSRIPVNQWTHLAFTWEGTTSKIYINGQLSASKTVTLQTVMDPYARIGEGHGIKMMGLLDEMRAYNRAITAQEASYLYSGFGASGQNKTQLSSGSKGLVGHWKLDGDTKDSSAYRNHGTVTGATSIADRNGKTNGAYNFAGMSQQINIASTLGLSNTNVTIATWVYIPTTSQHGAFIKIGNNQSASNNGYGLGVGSGTFESNGNNIIMLFENVRWINTGVPIGTGWHHVAMTIDGTGVPSAYLDGVLVNTSTGSNAIIPTAVSFIGGYASSTGTDRFLTGRMDDMRVYNRLLSQAEIDRLYDSYDVTVSASSLQKQMIGRWTFDGDTKDRSAYRNHVVTPTAVTAASDRHGVANRAYSFNGTSSYMTINDNDSLSPTAITVSAWVYPTTLDNAHNIVSKNGNEEYRYRLNASGTVTVFDRGATNTFTTTQTVPLNQWSHVAFTGDTSGIKVYINGQLAGTKATAYAAPNTTGVLRFGTFSGGNEFFAGAMDDVRIWARALSVTEMKAVYDGN